MKKTIIIAIVLAFALAMGMTACGSSGSADQSEQSAESQASESADAKASAPDTLVAYFSITGHTEGVANIIADVTGADTYRIEPEEAYTEEDLDYNADTCRSRVEQNDKSLRPAFKGEAPSLDGITTLYLGYPIWYGQEPRIMDTFVESLSLDGITIIPFCTSDNSDIGDSGKSLEQIAGSGTWLEGKRFEAGASEEEVKSWIEVLQLVK